MARNVTYSVAPRINPRDKEAAPKYYGRVQANGDVNIREMSERIQQTCTVHKADVQAVLLALEDTITDALKGGEIGRLGELGTLRVSLSSKGALTEKEYNTSLITRKRILFRPGTVLSEAMANLTFMKLKEKSDDEENTEEGSGEETTGGEAA